MDSLTSPRGYRQDKERKERYPSRKVVLPTRWDRGARGNLCGYPQGRISGAVTKGEKDLETGDPSGGRIKGVDKEPNMFLVEGCCIKYHFRGGRDEWDVGPGDQNELKREATT